ncbi:MAG: hypothetical protein HQK73_10645 [Desulfamplus sp.]|nr:hypothetical protein [Desulfamplus sp.]
MKTDTCKLKKPRQTKYMEVVLAVVLALTMVILQGCMKKPSPMSERCIHIDSMDTEQRISCYQEQLQNAPESQRAGIELSLKKEQYTLSMLYLEKGRALMQNNEFKRAMDAFRQSAAWFPDNRRAFQLLQEAENRQNSFELTDISERLIEEKSLPKAKDMLEKAVTLYPENERAVILMEQFKTSSINSSEYGILLESDEPFSLRFKETPIEDVFDVISRITNVNFIFDKDVRQQNVTMFVKDIKVSDFFEMLLKTNNIAAKQADRRTLMIYPDTPQKAQEYQDLQVKTFYLSYMKAKDALPVISKVLKIKDIIANEETNTITVRDTDKAIEIIAKLIQANDIPPSEVVLNVEMLEVNSTFQEKLGFSFSDSITFGISDTSSGINSSTNFRIAGFGSIHDLARISDKEVYLSIPTVTLSLLKQDADTRILARPTLRVSHKQKATILIGERIPLRSNRRTESDGTVTYDYQYQDVGIKLVATPNVNRKDEILLTLNLELSSLGSNVGTADDPQYAINTRSADTVLNVKDGNTVIIGGLTKKEDRYSIKKIPLLGEIPLISKLFTNNNTEDNGSDLLITITPVIISAAPIPDEKSSTFWSGNWQRLHTGEPFIKKMERNATDLPAIPKN